jgi:hypothetical protein
MKVIPLEDPNAQIVKKDDLVRITCTASQIADDANLLSSVVAEFAEAKLFRRSSTPESNSQDDPFIFLEKRPDSVPQA